MPYPGAPRLNKRKYILYARENRKNSTSMEGLLRHTVLKKKKLGYKFTRQKPIDYYIADFYCAKLKLVIEVDGSSHNHKKEYDQRRTNYLNSLGIKVIRYTNQEVNKSLGGVRQDIQGVIRDRLRELGISE